jgi:hypothetical protein
MLLSVKTPILAMTCFCHLQALGDSFKKTGIGCEFNRPVKFDKSDDYFWLDIF